MMKFLKSIAVCLAFYFAVWGLLWLFGRVFVGNL